ncbi:exopolyphosphatase [Pseudomarimonas salicorniae]|uniref:Exopolyphosphatase n=1 Tax=Pseudomarimonas salicorniae TaxID=2933270 RepID=A0ABT0GDH8_9GAMM|nr:exopolyphosphatase [Lysobacter sp. CAU 1642]MCK7592591.1 exopolyphosphatase [Lysobacter sp. CAU 1642]
MGDALKEGELFAAVDLGSNSFHMVVARHLLGQLRTVDRLRETVRMANGLDAEGGLTGEAMARALDCLSRLGQRVRTLPDNRVRVIATNTVRQLRNPQGFLVPAETALGHRIEVVSGREEARLIYLGVAHGHPTAPRKRRLVMDIGGGSTEFIIGMGDLPIERESLQMGCIASTRRFFAHGKLSKKRWKEALTEVSAEFQQFAAAYRSTGWQETFGSSGSIKAIGEILTEMKLSRGVITEPALKKLRDTLLEFDGVDDIRLPGLSEDRRPIIAGAILVLEAAFNELGIQRMQVAQTAMREGILIDMLGRASDRDPRDASIAALAKRYDVDLAQAQRVEQTVLALFEQVAERCGLGEEERDQLVWAARVHELGLSIAHSQYHRHGAYLLRHSDIAGFSTQDQQILATLVRCHRREISRNAISAIPERDAQSTLQSLVLLRLAVLLHRSHDPSPPPAMELAIDGGSVRLTLPAGWLDAHPLTRSDLDAEREYLAPFGLLLHIETR